MLAGLWQKVWAQRRIGYELFWILCGNVLAAAGYLCGVRWLTGVLEPSVYGGYSLAMTGTALFGMLLFFPLGGSIQRFYAISRERGEYFYLWRETWRWFLVLLAAVIPLGLLGIAGLALAGKLEVVREWWTAGLLSVGTSLTIGIAGIYAGVLTACRRRILVSLHKAVISWAGPAGAVLLCLYAGASVEHALLGVVIGSIPALLSYAYTHRRVFREIYTGDFISREKSGYWWRAIWEYNWPFVLWGGASAMQTSAGRWALEHYAGMTEVGCFAVLLQIGQYPINFIALAINQLAYPIICQRAGMAETPEQKKKALHITLLACVAFLGCSGIVWLVALLAHQEIFSLLVDHRYAGYSGLLPWIIAGSMFFNLGQITGLFVMVCGSSRMLLIPKILMAALIIGGDFVFAAGHGMRGIAVTEMLVPLLVAGYMLVLMWRVYRKARSPSATF